MASLPAANLSVRLVHMTELRSYQQADLDFLRSHPRAALWDEAGLGKTRPLLLAAEGKTLVVAPAGVRDTEVWSTEAGRIGLEAPEVISYHQAAKLSPASMQCDTLILDEGHRMKDRKVSWGAPIYDLAQRTERVYQASGTPIPNGATELWAQLRLIRPANRLMNHYWPWVREWFEPAPTRYSSYATSDALLGCRCRRDDDFDVACAHWEQFYRANIEGYAIRHLRNDVAKDLPPLYGDDTPLWTPMTAKQRKAYLSVRKDMLALLPDEGVTLEALTETHQFVMLQRLTAGLSCVDRDADPRDRQSGKLNYLRELLGARRSPTLAVVYFKSTAAAVIRICEELKLSYATLGAKETRPMRAQAVRTFAAGEVDVLIGALQVIKEGVDGLQYGSDEVVMVERYWVPGDNEQTIRRLHRLGQTRPVTVRQLVTPHSVDEEQWDEVKLKGHGIRRVLSPLEVATMTAAA